MSAIERLVLASGNPGKLEELTELLSRLVTAIVPQSYYFVPAAEETGGTFVENAIIKARNAAAHTGLPAIADDSGLEIPALDGAPGVRSARWAGNDASDADNNAQLRDALLDLDETQRSAAYRCVLVAMRHADDPAPLIAEGVWTGQLIETPQGSGGFGYDPHFYLPESGCTAAALPAETKHMLSHRGQALGALRRRLEQEWQSH
jgi:XTP/dITP diphosphohydrolase